MKIDGRTISDDGQIELRGHELIQHRRHRAARTARVRHRGGAERATHLLKNSWSGEALGIFEYNEKLPLEVLGKAASQIHAGLLQSALHHLKVNVIQLMINSRCHNSGLNPMVTTPWPFDNL